MCDSDQLKRIDEYRRHAAHLTRRDFARITVSAGAALLIPGTAGATDLIERHVDVPTPDGIADCHFVHPAEGAYPGVLVWPDARGLRPAYHQMGRRLAEAGYAVLSVNTYYRGQRAPVLPDGATPADAGTMETLRPLLGQLTPEGDVRDAIAFVEFLDAQTAVDTGRKIGTTGYCLGGPTTMRTAAAIPDRIGAGASFHGIRLATDEPDSPHRLVPGMRASFLFAIAEDDDAGDPQAKHVLREAFDAAGLDAEIEVYQGAMHGWCTVDSPVHNEAQAERAWGRLLDLFERALA
jgi:carboxymethylenebutenolidase